MDYNYQNSSNSYGSEPDYYAMYTEKQIKTARGVFSRLHFSLLLYLIISFVAVLVSEIALILILGTEGAVNFLSKHTFMSWILNFVPVYAVAFPIFFLAVRNMKTIPQKKRKMSFAEFFSLFLITEFLMNVGSMIGNIFVEFFSAIKGGNVVDRTDELIASMPIWLTLAIVVIIGPAIEELIFRKLMIDRLSRYGNAVAIIVSSVSFGLFHGNFHQLFYATLSGLVFGFIYAKTRNVLYSFAMHATVNFFGSVAVTPIFDKLDALTEGLAAIQSGVEVEMGEFFKNLMIVGSYSIIQYAIIIAGAVMLYKFIKYRKYNFRDSWEYKLPRERTASIIVMNPGTLAYIIVSVLLCAYSIIM